MTDKEFKRLSRAQLIDIIYQYQVKQDELTAENEKLSKALEDKRIRVTEAGNIAEAALELHKVMEAAQNAANHYIEEMQQRVDDECRRIVTEQTRKHKETQAAAVVALRQARQEALDIVAKAKAEAEAIRAQAQTEAAQILAGVRPQQEKTSHDPLEDILREFRRGR